MKKYMVLFMIAVLFCMNSTFVYAESVTNPLVIQWMTEEEKEELDNITDMPNPYTLYILMVHESLSEKDNGDLQLVGSAYCSETMAKIEILLEFQQLTPGGWYTLATGKDSDTDVTHFVAAGTISGAPSGTFRLKVTATVTDYNGFKEFSECCGNACINS